MKEANVKAAVKKYLKSVGAYYHMPMGTGFSAATLDFLVCHKGKFYGIETKRPGVDEVTARQACVMTEIAEAGGAVCLENTVTCDNVKKLIF
jgi:hypothetical protein